MHKKIGIIFWYCTYKFCIQTSSKQYLDHCFVFVSPQTWAREEALKRLAAKESGEAAVEDEE